MCDWIIVITNCNTNNMNLFRFYGTDQEVSHMLKTLALEDCRECQSLALEDEVCQDCRSSDLKVDEVNFARYSHQY